jgi:hypothetical protein
VGKQCCVRIRPVGDDFDLAYAFGVGAGNSNGEVLNLDDVAWAKAARGAAEAFPASWGAPS